ncbi:hypothetical protein, partial [Mesorhizobium sp.]
PTTGRYLQPDPLGMPDGPSRWAYVQNSPLMGVDREGLKTDGLSRTLLPSPKPSLLMSVPKLDEPDGPLFCETKVEKEERCFQQCQHLMGVGHGNEYRGCFRRCMGEFLGP